jgi:hypothetical protein
VTSPKYVIYILIAFKLNKFALQKASNERFKAIKEPAVHKLPLKRKIGYGDEDDTQITHVRQHNEDMQIQQD